MISFHPRVSYRQLLASLFLLIGSTAWSAIENQEVLIGFFAPGVNAQPVTRMYGDIRYNINAATAPVDVGRVGLAHVAYLDQFPSGVTPKEETIKALRDLMERGGVVFLLSGPDSSESTIDFFNRLGRGLGVEFTENILEGEIIPAIPGQGPLDGNVWYCEQGVRGLQLNGGDWTIHHFGRDGRIPVVASRAVGNGLLFVTGTREVERPDAVNPQSALTLITWGYMHSAGRSANERPVSDEAYEKVTPTNDDVERILKSPRSNLLADRVKEMRQVYNPENPDEPLTRNSLLIPRVDRQYFPPLSNASDLDKELVDLDDYRGRIVLLVYWATWNEDSTQLVLEIDEMIKSINNENVQAIGVTLDASEQAVKEFVAENNIEWRQVYDGRAFGSSLTRRPLIRRIPRTFLLDADGRLAAGDLPMISMQHAILEVLEER